MSTPLDQGAGAAVPTVLFALPAPPLRPWLTTYYCVHCDGPLVDQLHPEWANIRFTISGEWRVELPGSNDPTPAHAALFGPTDISGSVRCTNGGTMVGIGLTGLGWATLIGRDADAHANRVEELSDILGPAAATLWADLCAAPDWAARVALLDDVFGRLVAAAPPADPLIARVQQALVTADLDTVVHFAEGLGVTERTLSRLCHRVFGFAPKRLLRRQRFLRTLANIGDQLDPPLGVLLDGGYYDQSHFIREFKAYMGMTPLAYFHSPRQMMRRAATERQRAAGARMQGLHRPA
ncbi:MAG: hypothetical protein RIS17_1974 [Pseudomonadota bacterium]|jgi:AraC-like DNA-binding protein